MAHDIFNPTDALIQMFLTDYFKISPKLWSDAKGNPNQKTLDVIANKCAQRAYLDYNRTLNFIDAKKDHTEFRGNIYKISVEQVKELMGKEERDGDNGFEAIHKKACEAIIKISDCEQLEQKFSYGQAQKQLNMTIKYMWLLNLWPAINSITDNLHATVDNYILEAAWEISTIKIPVKGNCKRNKLSLEKGAYKYSSGKLERPWSQWIDEDYTEFQKSLREYVKHTDYKNVFEWELDIWPQIASKNN